MLVCPRPTPPLFLPLIHPPPNHPRRFGIQVASAKLIAVQQKNNTPAKLRARLVQVTIVPLYPLVHITNVGMDEFFARFPLLVRKHHFRSDFLYFLKAINPVR